MIICKVGRVGEGKSATASREIKEWVDSGRQVYTNLHVNESRPNYHYFKTEDWKIIFKLQDGIIIFDEGQFILDARAWSKTPVEFRHLLQKGRHEGLDFYILTQNILQIDSMARRLIHEAKMVKKVFSKQSWNFGIYLEWSIDISGLDSQRIDSYFPVAGYVMLKEDWQYYDSHALRSRKKPPKNVPCVDCGIVHQIGIGASVMNTGDDLDDEDDENEEKSYPHVIPTQRLQKRSRKVKINVLSYNEKENETTQKEYKKRSIRDMRPLWKKFFGVGKQPRAIETRGTVLQSVQRVKSNSRKVIHNAL